MTGQGPVCGWCSLPIHVSDDGFCSAECEEKGWRALLESHGDDRLERAAREELAGRCGVLREAGRKS